MAWQTTQSKTETAEEEKGITITITYEQRAREWQYTAVVLVPDEAVLRQADADAGERDADAEPDAAAGADVADDLGPEPRPPPNPAPEPQPDPPERAHRRVHGVPPLVPPQHPLDYHPRLHLHRRRHLHNPQTKQQKKKKSISDENCWKWRGRGESISSGGNTCELRGAFGVVDAAGSVGGGGGGGGGWWIWGESGMCVGWSRGLDGLEEEEATWRVEQWWAAMSSPWPPYPPLNLSLTHTLESPSTPAVAVVRFSGCAFWRGRRPRGSELR